MLIISLLCPKPAISIAAVIVLCHIRIPYVSCFICMMLHGKCPVLLYYYGGCKPKIEGVDGCREKRTTDRQTSSSNSSFWQVGNMSHRVYGVSHTLAYKA